MRLVTRATGTRSRAPAAALATTGESGQARSLGITTPWAPAAAALRSTAPRLWGSWR